MALNGLGQKVTVHVGECGCPHTPHASGDEVYLAPKISVALGSAAIAGVNNLEAGSTGTDVEAVLARVYLRQGVIGWNLVDEEGEPVPATPRAVEERLTWGSGGMEVVNKADELYAEDLFAPLVAARKRKSSADGPTDPSTSPPSPSGQKPPESLTSSSDEPTDGQPSEAPTE